MHADTSSVAHAETLEWVNMIYSACVSYCVSVDIERPAQVWAYSTLGGSQERGTPVLVRCSTASAGMHCLMTADDGGGNISFPLKVVGLGKRKKPNSFNFHLILVTARSSSYKSKEEQSDGFPLSIYWAVCWLAALSTLCSVRVRESLDFRLEKNVIEQGRTEVYVKL